MANGGYVAAVPTLGVESAVTNGVGGGLPSTSTSSPPGMDNEDMSSSGMENTMMLPPPLGEGVAAEGSKMLWIGG